MRNIFLNFTRTFTVFLLVANLNLSNSLQAQSLSKENSNSKVEKNEASGKTGQSLTGAISWQSAVLRADGSMDVGGVETFCLRTTCGNEDIILIKFINKNDFKVRVEWIDAIKTAGGWIYSKNSTPKILNLEPGATVIGQCDGMEKLKLKVNSILENPIDFGHYATSGLITIKLR